MSILGHPDLHVARENDKLLEAQRIEQRTRYDLEMMQQLGYTNGIENYSRHLSGRSAGEAPPTLFDYIPDDALLIIDESHVTVPQIGAMTMVGRCVCAMTLAIV